MHLGSPPFSKLSEALAPRAATHSASSPLAPMTSLTSAFLRLFWPLSHPLASSQPLNCHPYPELHCHLPDLSSPWETESRGDGSQIHTSGSILTAECQSRISTYRGHPMEDPPQKEIHQIHPKLSSPNCAPPKNCTSPYDPSLNQWHQPHSRETSDRAGNPASSCPSSQRARAAGPLATCLARGMWPGKCI